MANKHFEIPCDHLNAIGETATSTPLALLTFLWIFFEPLRHNYGFMHLAPQGGLTTALEAASSSNLSRLAANKPAASR